MITTMVTTRRQSGSNSDPAKDVSPTLESAPQDIRLISSKKRRRTQPADESTSHASQDNSAPVMTRKRQKLPERERDEQQFDRHAHIAVEIPVRDIVQGDTPARTTSEQGKAKKGTLAEDTTIPEVQGKDNQNDDELEECQTPHAVAQEAFDEVTSLPEKSKDNMTKRVRRKKVDSKSIRNKKSSPAPVNASVSNTTKPKHKRFDSEEPATEEFDRLVEEPKVEAEDESSDDDAPEVVATHDAQEKAKNTARSAAKAVEEYVSRVLSVISC